MLDSSYVRRATLMEILHGLLCALLDPEDHGTMIFWNISNQPMTQHHIPYRLSLKQHGCENLKSRLHHTSPPPKKTCNMLWASHSQRVSILQSSEAWHPVLQKTDKPHSNTSQKTVIAVNTVTGTDLSSSAEWPYKFKNFNSKVKNFTDIP
jgi:hypothetical protein